MGALNVEQPQRSYKTSLPSVTPMCLNIAWQGNTVPYGSTWQPRETANKAANLEFLALISGQALGSRIP